MNPYETTYKHIKIDPYRILKEYEITHPCQQHSLKKLLRLGRTHKPLIQDLQEVIDTLERWKNMMIEDAVDPCKMDAEDSVDGVKPNKKWICGHCILGYADAANLYKSSLLKDGSVNEDGSKATCFVCDAAQHQYAASLNNV